MEPGTNLDELRRSLCWPAISLRDYGAVIAIVWYGSMEYGLGYRHQEGWNLEAWNRGQPVLKQPLRVLASGLTYDRTRELARSSEELTAIARRVCECHLPDYLERVHVLRPPGGRP